MDGRRWVERLAESTELDLQLDEYNVGPAIERLEHEVAGLLGKEFGLFFHKGVVAQQAVLLAHAARGNRRIVALHPKSHIAFDEADALDRLAGSFRCASVPTTSRSPLPTSRPSSSRSPPSASSFRCAARPFRHRRGTS